MLRGGALARRAAAQAPHLARNLLGSGWQCAVWTPHLVSRTARGYFGGQPLSKLLFRPVAPKPGARSHGTELGAGAGERGWRAYWNWKLPAYATRLRIVFRFTRVIVLGYGNDSACGRHHMHTLTHARARSRRGSTMGNSCSTATKLSVMNTIVYCTICEEYPKHPWKKEGHAPKNI